MSIVLCVQGLNAEMLIFLKCHHVMKKKGINVGVFCDVIRLESKGKMSPILVWTAKLLG